MKRPRKGNRGPLKVYAVEFYYAGIWEHYGYRTSIESARAVCAVALMSWGKENARIVVFHRGGRAR